MEKNGFQRFLSQVSAAMSGLATGALFFVPLGRVFGRWSITFWSLLGCLACAVWSARMTRQRDYVDFIASRLLSGLFGAVPSAVGGGMILDLFFLHQRGRAFICYEISILFGATVGPTFSGFIAGTTSWTWCFWWTVPLLAITAALVFLFAEETTFDRQRGKPPAERPHGFARSRVATFFPGTAVVAVPSGADIVGSVRMSWKGKLLIHMGPT
jgi:MFS family permease